MALGAGAALAQRMPNGWLRSAQPSFAARMIIPSMVLRSASTRARHSRGIEAISSAIFRQATATPAPVEARLLALDRRESTHPSPDRSSR